MRSFSDYRSNLKIDSGQISQHSSQNAPLLILLGFNQLNKIARLNLPANRENVVILLF